MFYCSFVSIHYIICECGDTFPTEDALKEHLERDHQPKLEKTEYKCDICEKVFATERACLIHQRVHTAPRTPRIKEPRDKEKRSPKKYYNIKNIVCEVCGKRYASNAALGYHQRVHTGERPYQCSECPKNFTMPLFLQIHMRTHTGERPYECPHCPKAFSNKAALLRHDRVHTGVKPYECPKCGKFFTQSNSMKLHVKTVHLKMPAPYKSKNRRNKQANKNRPLKQREVATLHGIESEEDEINNFGVSEKDRDLQDLRELQVEVQIQSGMVKQEIKSEVKTEVQVLEDSEYQIYHDEVYEEGSELYQGVEIGHPEITMYEVEDSETQEILYKPEDIKGEILYEVEDYNGQILYEDGERAEIQYENGETAEILYEGDDRVYCEEVYEEAI
ncbi:uncharacterized protein [Epargyreus clarus]|uniref:uncharacterized protein isoform X1 n=1 Tax=Epargyreus clarus TaxID=520877 RepID=UPI003C3038EC